MDVFRSDSDLIVRAELPGIDPESDLEITIEDGVLRIAGQRSDETIREDDSFHLRERRFGSFRRELALPDGVDVDAVGASYTDGVLTLTIPIPEEKSETRRITVDVG